MECGSPAAAFLLTRVATCAANLCRELCRAARKAGAGLPQLQNCVSPISSGWENHTRTLEAYSVRIDRFSHLRAASSQKLPPREAGRALPQLVPFGPLGGGQWTGHPIGLVIVLGFIAMGVAGVPEWRGFFLLSASLGVLLGGVLWLWHRSRSSF